MNALLDVLKRPRQPRLVHARPRRRITLIAPDRDAATAVIRQVFGSVGRDAMPIQTDDDWQHLLDHPPTLPDDAPDDALRLSVLHLPQRRLGHPVPWEFCVPASLNVREGAKASWRNQSDTLVVCWPGSALGASADSLGEAAMRLGGTIGKARHLGRLRRVAFVITGTPASAGPRHPSQIRLNVPPDASLRTTLRTALERAERAPGDPLADPEWRRWLADCVQNDRPLSEVVRMAGQAVGRECPIFFVGEQPLADALLPLVEWINDSRPADRARTGLAAKLLVTAAAALCVLAFASILTLPRPWRLSGPVSGLGVSTLEHEVSRRLTLYDRWWGVADALAADHSRADLEHANDLLQRYREISRRASALRQFVTGATAGVPALSDSGRSVRAGVIAARVTEELASWDDYRAKHPELELRREWLQPWSAAIAHAIVQQTMLGAQRREGGFAGFDLAAGHDAELLERLSALGGAQEASALAVLAQLRAPEAFYRRLDAARHVGNAAVAATFRDGAVNAPRMIVDEKQFRTNGAYRNTWRDLCRAFGPDTALFREFVVGAPMVVAGAPAEVVMQIQFEASFGDGWHVDVKAANSAEYLPALWVAASGQGCVVQLDRARRDMPLTLYLNPTSKWHVLQGQDTDGPCSSADHTQILLVAPEGDVAFPSGKKLHYRVIKGWPGVPDAGGQS